MEIIVISKHTPRKKKHKDNISDLNLTRNRPNLIAK